MADRRTKAELLAQIEMLEQDCKERQRGCFNENEQKHEALKELKKVQQELTELKAEKAELAVALQCSKLEVEKLTTELLRRGADHSDKPRPPCGTAFAALQVVCKSWDRDVCFDDLRKQRNRARVEMEEMKTGRLLKMNDVLLGMFEEDYIPRLAWEECNDMSLYEFLAKLRRQLFAVHYQDRCLEWEEFPMRILVEGDEESESDDDVF